MVKCHLKENWLAFFQVKRRIKAFSLVVIDVDSVIGMEMHQPQLKIKSSSLIHKLCEAGQLATKVFVL